MIYIISGVRILASKLVEQWLKIARSEIPTQNTNVLNKENVLNAQGQIIVQTVDQIDVNNIDASLSMTTAEMDAIDAIEALDAIDGNSNDIDGEYGENEALIFKFTMKDGIQTLAKVNDASPKKASPKDADASKRSKSSESRSKDGKDRDKSKDRHDKKKSSSSSSSHKSSSSSSKSPTSSSSKSGTSSSKSTSSSSSSSKSHKSSSHKSSSSGSSSSSSRDKDKSKKSSSSSSSKDREREKERAKEASKAAQAEKDRDTLAKIQSQALPKVGKIPKKTNTDVGDQPASDTDKTADRSPVVIKKKEKSISIEVRKDVENRPKTVKTYNSQFRSHGLGEEAPPPPSRRDLKKPPAIATSPSLTLASGTAQKRSISPTNSKEVEKKIKLATAATASATGDKPGAIKLIQAKPKRKYICLIRQTNWVCVFILIHRSNTIISYENSCVYVCVLVVIQNQEKYKALISKRVVINSSFGFDVSWMTNCFKSNLFQSK